MAAPTRRPSARRIGLITSLMVLSFVAGGWKPAGAQAAPDGSLRCDAAGIEPLPEDAQVRCDSSRGWRLSAWIGASGDGIVRVERAEAAWVPLFEGPFCATGVAAASPDALMALGMPQELAAAWGYGDGDCLPVADGELPPTGARSGPLAFVGVVAVVIGAAVTKVDRRRSLSPHS